MSEYRSERPEHETWNAFYAFNALDNPKFKEISEAMQQFTTTITMWNHELLSFGAKRASEYAKLPERLMKCQAAPDILKLELEYLDAMRRDYADEVPRLLSLGDEFVKRSSVMPWAVGNSASTEPIEAASPSEAVPENDNRGNEAPKHEKNRPTRDKPAAAE
jgi:hypothetical protein